MTAQLTSLKVVCQLFTPHLILPESGCSEATAYAKERKIYAVFFNCFVLNPARHARSTKGALMKLLMIVGACFHFSYQTSNIKAPVSVFACI